jgi:enoyl-CoA hydratase/carnithine racemase
MEKIISNFYEVEVKDSLVIIFFKKDVFKLLTTREGSDLLFKTLNNFHSDTQIKALLFINKPECFGEKVYDSFLNEIISTETEEKDHQVSNITDRHKRSKEIYTLNRFVEYLANYRKICFTVLSGGIVTPFFGVSLTMDIRYATPDMTFLLAHNKYALHPSGGLPYFLIQQIGYNKAMEVLLSNQISSEKALELGLINKIVPSENFLEGVINDIEIVTNLQSCTLRRTKQLAAYTRDSLPDYFEFEGKLLNLI